MNYLLRKIKVSLWPKKSLKDNPPLSADELAKIISDLDQGDNRVSVFLVENDGDIEAVIAGIAGGRLDIKTITYILIKKDYIDEEGFVLEETPGDTTLPAADDLHRNIVITAPEEYEKLAKCLYEKGEQKDKSKSLVSDILIKKKDQLDPNKMKPDMRKKLKIE